MAKYLQRYFLDVPAEPVEKIVQEFLAQNDFKPTQWEGEACWGSDVPTAGNVRYFRYKYENRVIEMEAWLRSRKNTDMGLTGFEAKRLKNSYLDLIEGLIEQLIKLVPEDSPLFAIDRDTLAQDRYLRRTQPFILPGAILFVLFLIFVLPKII